MRYVLEGGWRSLCFCQVLGRGQGGGDLSSVVFSKVEECEPAETRKGLNWVVGALRQKSGGRIWSNFIARRREEASKESSRESSDLQKNLLRHWTFPISFCLDFLHCSYNNMWSGAMMPFCGEILTQDICLQLVVTCIGKLLIHLRLQCMLILRSQPHLYISWYSVLTAHTFVWLSDQAISKRCPCFAKTAFVYNH